MMIEEYCYLPFAAAYVRGCLRDEHSKSALFGKAFSALTVEELAELYLLGKEAGLKLHRFKRTGGLPRVQCVIGILRGFQPQNLLDIGSGRGAFLWPLLDAFDHLTVTAVDRLEHRVALCRDVHRGGLGCLHAARMDTGSLAFPDQSFDGITLLEVLEHIPDPGPVIAEVCRVAGRFVVLSVPSKADNNPEHRHLFTPHKLEELFQKVGSFRIKFDTVLNHLVLIAVRR